MTIRERRRTTSSGRHASNTRHHHHDRHAVPSSPTFLLSQGGAQQPSLFGMPLPRRLAVAYGAVLAFNSGYMNGLCLHGIFWDTKQAVAAMTGSYTNSALAAAATSTTAQPSFLALQMKVLFGYISGAAVAGALNPRPDPFHIHTLNVGVTFWLAAAALVVAQTFFLDGSQGDTSRHWFFALAAVANGMQNSITSVHTANLVRTTHYTGISSDMGTFVGQALRGNWENVHKLKVFALLALSFWTGGFLSVKIGTKRNGLWASARLYAILGGVLLYQNVKQWQQHKVTATTTTKKMMA